MLKQTIIVVLSLFCASLWAQNDKIIYKPLQVFDSLTRIHCNDKGSKILVNGLKKDFLDVQIISRENASESFSAKISGIYYKPGLTSFALEDEQIILSDTSNFYEVKKPHNLWTQIQPLEVFNKLDSSYILHSYDIVSKQNIKELFFSAKTDSGSYNIYSAVMRGTHWFATKIEALNSSFDELYPQVTSDLKYIYFTSNRNGTYDLFRYDTQNEALEPLMSQINSDQYDEYSLCLFDNGNQAYYLTDTSKDIIHIKDLLMKTAKTESMLVGNKGVFESSNNELVKLIENIISHGDQKAIENLETYISNKAHSTQRHYSSLIDVVENLIENEDQQMLENLSLITEYGSLNKSLTLFYASGQDSISANQKNKLKAFLEQLNNEQIYVKGYSDAQGSAETKYRISEQRAQQVIDYLVQAFAFEQERLKKLVFSDLGTEGLPDRMNRKVELEAITK